MTSTEEAFKLLADAGERLSHAGANLRMGIYGPSVAMAYYAAFYAAQAVVAYHREGPKTHQGVQTRFHHLAVESSDFSMGVARLLGGLMEDRLMADYAHDKMGTWTVDEASAALERARTFVQEVSAWFARHHPTENETDRSRP